MSEPVTTSESPGDDLVRAFLQHLATDRDASIYTQRNYGHALAEFSRWHRDERGGLPFGRHC